MLLITSKTLLSRRNLLRQLGLTGAFATMPGLMAEALTLTPKLTEGPYYPSNTPFNNIPLDKDNDLVLLNDSTQPAKGLITHVAGRVLNERGEPIRGALVEMWHADAAGEYTHSTTAERNPQADKNFAGFGQFLTGKDGAYRFRTIKAGLYRGRTRHIHMAVTLPGEKSRISSQLFWNEKAYDQNGKLWSIQNDNDNVLGVLRDPAQRQSLIGDFQQVTAAAAPEEKVVWDMVMGTTVFESNYPETPGGELIVQGEAVAGSKTPRWKVSVPAYPEYAYEVYANPTHGTLGYAALPFALTPEGKLETNIIKAEKEGRLDLYVEKESVKGAYLIGWRLPGANLGTPSGRGTRPGGPPPGGRDQAQTGDTLEQLLFGRDPF